MSKRILTSLLTAILGYGMAASEPYYFDPNMLQTPNDSIEDIEMNNRFKIEFADLVKDTKSVGGFFLPADFESVEMTSHKQGQTAKEVSKWRPPKSLLSKTKFSSG